MEAFKLQIIKTLFAMQKIASTFFETPVVKFF